MTLNEISAYLLRFAITELAVEASRPVVGSSRKRTPGAMIISIPTLHRFLSPPDTPLINSSPTFVSAHNSAKN